MKKNHDLDEEEVELFGGSDDDSELEAYAHDEDDLVPSDKRERRLKRRKREAHRIKKVIKEINQLHSSLEVSARRSVHLAQQLGRSLVELKRLTKLSGKKWESYRDEIFPYLNSKSAQRYMNLAKLPDLEANPSLAAAGEIRLLDLARATKNQDIDDVLKDHQISTEFDVESIDDVKSFRDDIDSLIEKSSPASRKKPLGIKILLLRLLNSSSSLLAELKKIKKDKTQLKQADPAGLDKAIETFTEVCEVLEQLRKRVRRLANK